MSPELTRARGLLSHLVSEPDATMDDYRKLYDEVLANFTPPQDAAIEPVDANGVPCIWVSAPGSDPTLVTLFVHGGGWCMGNAYGYRELGYRLSAASGSRVLVVDYRLAPENPFPAPLDDVVIAYRWARDLEGVREVALAGDSAGGGLVAGAAVALRDASETAPTCVVAMSPLVDLAGEGASLMERADVDPLPAAALVAGMGAAYLAGREPKQTPLASPLYADLSGLPPFLVLVGTDEGLYDDSTRLVEKIRDRGGDATLEVGESMIHIWPLFNFLPEAASAVELIGNFLSKRFADN
ncbi:alpha/beta hydrolase [Rhodococcus ruber]|uniref:alpha/beta hydrolase n=1 Tax=Rhodococcus ruber TaxID=1830 RepID=UPI00315CBFD9